MSKTLKTNKRPARVLPKSNLSPARRITSTGVSGGHPHSFGEASGKATGVHKAPSLAFEDEPLALIQWPSEAQIDEVCNRLYQIKKIGVQNEQHGDYFNSGDLAYQVQEIIKATDELFRKSQRVKHRAEG